MSASAWDWDFIRACRDGEADLSKEPPLSKAERQHRTYLRIIAKDPDYYTRRRRAERKARRQAKETKMCKKISEMNLEEMLNAAKVNDMSAVDLARSGIGVSDLALVSIAHSLERIADSYDAMSRAPLWGRG